MQGLLCGPLRGVHLLRLCGGEFEASSGLRTPIKVRLGLRGNCMLKYDDGGLRNVWLANGYETRDTAYGKTHVGEDEVNHRQRLLSLFWVTVEHNRFVAVTHGGQVVIPATILSNLKTCLIKRVMKLLV